MSEIEWSDGPVWQTCECRCGHFYRSHAKCVKGADGVMRIVSRIPCSDCGRTLPKAVRGDMESHQLSLGE